MPKDLLIMTDRPLTDKEQKVVDAFDAARPGLGERVERDIRHSETTGFADRVAKMPDEDIKVTEGFSSNSHTYRRIGG